MNFRNFLQESIEDKGILKAAFLAGSPGAGKSYTYSELKSGQIEPRIINTDNAYPLFKDSWNEWVKIKTKVLSITESKLLSTVNSMLPIVVDGTSNSTSSVLRRVGILESIGYDASLMVFVNTNLEVAIKRASKRERNVDSNFINRIYKEINEAKDFYKSKFPIFIEISNNDGELNNAVINSAFKKMMSYYLSPVKNPVGKRIISKMKEKRLKYLIPEIYTKEEIQKLIFSWYK